MENMHKQKVVSGMRPTGKIHLGNYFGALKNWVAIQDKYDCMFFAADWHVLTTAHEDTKALLANSREMITDWLAAGLDPEKCVIFQQSRVPEHAELATLLGMITPVGWLLRCPTYKEQLVEIFQKKYAGQLDKKRDQSAGKLMTALNESAGLGGDESLAAASELASYGFLGYPVLQTADIAAHGGTLVPIGQDQLAHLEISRDIVRRFGDLYGKGVLQEPRPLLTEVPKVPGLDGRKMSKSYGNAIELSETPESLGKKVSRMFTDPNKKRADDKGTPSGCVVFAFHKIYNPDYKSCEAQCLYGTTGCVNCKRQLSGFIETQLGEMRDRRERFEKDPALVDKILEQGNERARQSAAKTLRAVRTAMKLS